MQANFFKLHVFQRFKTWTVLVINNLTTVEWKNHVPDSFWLVAVQWEGLFRGLWRLPGASSLLPIAKRKAEELRKREY